MMITYSINRKNLNLRRFETATEICDFKDREAQEDFSSAIHLLVELLREELNSSRKAAD